MFSCKHCGNQHCRKSFLSQTIPDMQYVILVSIHISYVAMYIAIAADCGRVWKIIIHFHALALIENVLINWLHQSANGQLLF